MDLRPTKGLRNRLQVNSVPPSPLKELLVRSCRNTSVLYLSKSLLILDAVPFFLTLLYICINKGCADGQYQLITKLNKLIILPGKNKILPKPLSNLNENVFLN